MSGVKFKSNNPSGRFEFREVSEDDFTISPIAFQNEDDDNAHCVLVDQYGMLFENGNTANKPYYYMRHALIDDSRLGGVIELGDDFLKPQISGDTKDFYQRGEIKDTYKKLQDEENEGFVYGYSVDNPSFNFKFYKDHALWNEGDGILDLKVRHIGPAIVDHQAAFKNLPEVFIGCVYEGTYRGKKVAGMGDWAKNYQLAHKKENILTSLGYITLDMMGIREDDRFEHSFIAIDQTGTVAAYYYIDGEEPVTSNEVEFDAIWYRLPYVDDGTCVFGDAIIKFANKELHFKAKWGTKGVTEKPRVEKHGQSHVLGTWYEGDAPYKHKMYFTFSENMEAYDYKLEKMGFEVR